MSFLETGTLVLHGRYRLVRQLGEGGMGVVWEVSDVASGARLAIKFVKEEEASATATRRLLREAQAATAIAHPNIVRVHEVIDDGQGAAAIVMELLDGESLGARLERTGPLTLGQTAAILRPVVSALRAAHAAGVIHRDLKPDNVFLVTRDDGTTDVCVLDFGVAKQIHLPADSLTVTGSIVGTPMYMSPEQASGERGLDARTDVWSLAVIAFECLTGTTPVSGDNYGQLLARLIRGEIVRLASVRESLPPDVLALVDGALVARDKRASELDSMEATFARHADLAIDKTLVNAFRDGVRLPSASRTRASMDETQLATSAGDSGVTKKKAGLGRMMVGGLAVGTFVGSIAYVQSRPAPAPALAIPLASHVEAPVVASHADADALVSVAPDASPPTQSNTAPSASASASAKPASSGRARAVAPRASAASTPAPSGPERLPGGVGGNVPF